MKYALVAVAGLALLPVGCWIGGASVETIRYCAGSLVFFAGIVVAITALATLVVGAER